MAILIPSISRITEGAIKTSSRYASWRMIHDGSTLIVHPFASDGETMTRGILFEAPLLSDCLSEIASLGLSVGERQQRSINKLSQEDLTKLIG